MGRSGRGSRRKKRVELSISRRRASGRGSHLIYCVVLVSLYAFGCGLPCLSIRGLYLYSTKYQRPCNSITSDLNSALPMSPVVYCAGGSDTARDCTQISEGERGERAEGQVCVWRTSPRRAVHVEPSMYTGVMSICKCDTLRRIHPLIIRGTFLSCYVTAYTPTYYTRHIVTLKS